MNNSFATSSLHHAEPDDFEDMTLGSILVGALDFRYENAEDVMKDVRLAASKMGIRTVDDDEVDIDEKWEDIFEVRNQKLCFRI